MAEIATVIVLSAGSVTFVNQWYWTHNLDWKVPVATVLLAAGIDGLSHLDRKLSVTLSLLILLGALTTEFNGHSAMNTVSSFLANRSEAPSKGSVGKTKWMQ